MVIMKMNNVLVKHSKTLFGVFTGVIIISFVWFFTPGMDGSMFFSGGASSQNAVVGQVFGQKVRNGDLRRNIGRDAIVLGASYGGSPRNYMEYASKNAFESYAVLLAAKKLGVSVSDEEVVTQIKSLPAFQGKNGFDVTLYDQYEKEFLAPLGYSKHDLEEAFRDAIARVTLPSRFTETVLVTDSEVSEYEKVAMETYKARTVLFPYDEFSKGLDFSEDDLIAFHKANGLLFMTEPAVDAEIIAFFNADYKPDASAVTDEQIRAYYEQNRDSFKKKDGSFQTLAESTARIRNELLRDLSRRNANAAAKAFREDLYTLADTAEYASDPEGALRSEMGKKGYRFIPVRDVHPSAKAMDNIGPEKELIAALFSLEKPLQISSTVQGTNGSFIAVLKNRREPVSAPYEDVREEVRKVRVSQEGMVRAKEAARNFPLLLSESANPGKDLVSLAESVKAKVAGMKDFTLRDAPSSADIKERIARSMAASTRTGELSQPQNLPEGVLLVFVDSRIQPDAKLLEESRPLFESMALMSKRQTAATAFMQWIMANSASYLARPDEEEASNPE